MTLRSIRCLCVAAVVLALGRPGIAGVDALPSGVLPWIADPLDSQDLRRLRWCALLSPEQSAFTAHELERYAASYDALRNEHFDRYVVLLEQVLDIPYRRPPNGDLEKFHALRDSLQRDTTALDDAYFASIADSLTDDQRTQLEQFGQRRARDRLCADALVRAWFVAGRPTEIRDLLPFDTLDPHTTEQLDAIVAEHERSVTQILEKLARQANATRAAWLEVVDKTEFESIVRNERQKTPELREMHRVTAYAWRDAVDAAQPLLEAYDAQVTATLERLQNLLRDEAMATFRLQWTRLEHDADRREPFLAELTEADLAEIEIPADIRQQVLLRLESYRRKLIEVEAEVAANRRAEHARTMPLSTFARDVADDTLRVNAMRSARALDVERVRLYDDLRQWLGPKQIETLRIAIRARLDRLGVASPELDTPIIRPMRLNPPEFATVMELLPRHPQRSFLLVCVRTLDLDAAQRDRLREELAADDHLASLTETYAELGRIQLQPASRTDAHGQRVRVLPAPDTVSRAAGLIEQAQSTLAEFEASVISALSRLDLPVGASELDSLRLRLSAERMMPGLMRGSSPDASGESILNLPDLLETAELAAEDRVKAIAVVHAHIDRITERQRACWEATRTVWELQQLAMIERAMAPRETPATDDALRLERASEDLASCHQLAATANRQILDEIEAAISPAGGEAMRRRFRLLSFPAPARWEQRLNAMLLRAHALVSQHQPGDVESMGEYFMIRRNDVSRLADDWRLLLAHVETEAAGAPPDGGFRLSLILQQNERSRRELASMIRLWLENRPGA